MFTLLKNAVQMKEIRNRLLFTLMILIIFRIGSQVTVPGVNAGAIQTFATTGIFGLLNISLLYLIYDDLLPLV